MNETTIIRRIAGLAPWLAPLPGAYFVARSSALYLLAAEPPVLRWAVAALIGVVIELVSLAAFHTRLDLDRWNRLADARKWEHAPLGAVTLAIAVYFIGVVLLLIVLEALPGAARWAPVFFPFLGVAGVVVLGVIGQHGDRKDRYNLDDALRPVKTGKPETERKPEKARKPETRRAETESRKAAVLAEWPDLLTMPTGKAAELAGVSDRTIRNWRRNGNHTH